MYSLRLLLISVMILFNAFNSLCDIKESVNQNKSHIILNMSSTVDTNQTNPSISPMIGTINITNGFILRTLFVVTVISMFLSLICIIRIFCSSRRWKRSKVTNDWSHPKYDSLPAVAINDSIKKNAFALIDSEDEEFTIFDASHRLIK